MNEANLDPDYESAVVELRQGQRKGLLKFCSFMLLVAMVVGFVAALVLSVGDFVKAIAGV